MNLFREDNTEGHTTEELNALNNEWAELVEEQELEEGTEEYNEAASQFSDEVASR